MRVAMNAAARATAAATHGRPSPPHRRRTMRWLRRLLGRGGSDRPRIPSRTTRREAIQIESATAFRSRAACRAQGLDAKSYRLKSTANFNRSKNCILTTCFALTPALSLRLLLRGYSQSVKLVLVLVRESDTNTPMSWPTVVRSTDWIPSCQSCCTCSAVGEFIISGSNAP